MEHVNNAIKVLNRIHEADPTVLQSLVFHRVPCNKEVANDPEVQVGQLYEGGWEVGLLGIINGLLGIHESGYGYIQCDIDDDGKILRFSRSLKTLPKRNANGN